MGLKLSRNKKTIKDMSVGPQNTATTVWKEFLSYFRSCSLIAVVLLASTLENMLLSLGRWLMLCDLPG